MPHVATNKTDAPIPVRDENGKRFVNPGDSTVLSKHAAGAARVMGLDVEWVKDHDMQDYTAPATAEPDGPEAVDSPEKEAEAKPKRKASVVVRED